jgi:hypothetical protein
MELKERIKQYTPTKYNPYYWWRRFKSRDTKHPYTILQTRIENGDFEVSDYHWWMLWENELEQEAISKERNVDKQHELRGLYGERKRRLMTDFEKDEAKIKSEMYRAFKIEFRIDEAELEDAMLEFDGTLIEFYYELSDKRNKHIGHALGKTPYIPSFKPNK